MNVINSVNNIQYFQFSNLLKNRIPFVLLNLETEVAELFAIQEKIHLRNLSHSIEIKDKNSETLFKDILELLKELKLPSYHPVILICQDGTLSEKLGLNLVEKVEAPLKFENIYVVKNGIQGLRQEIEQN